MVLLNQKENAKYPYEQQGGIKERSENNVSLLVDFGNVHGLPCTGKTEFIKNYWSWSTEQWTDSIVRVLRDQSVKSYNYSDKFVSYIDSDILIQSYLDRGVKRNLIEKGLRYVFERPIEYIIRNEMYHNDRARFVTNIRNMVPLADVTFACTPELALHRWIQRDPESDKLSDIRKFREEVTSWFDNWLDTVRDLVDRGSDTCAVIFDQEDEYISSFFALDGYYKDRHSDEPFRYSRSLITFSSEREGATVTIKRYHN